MKTALAFVVAAILFFPGCATTANYEATLQTWVGASEDALIQSWGPPTSSYTSASATYLTWDRSSQGYYPGTAPTYQTTYVGNTAYTNSYGGSPGFVYSASCATTFTVVDHRITNWRWQGNACRSR